MAGYHYYSMSNNAVAAYENDEMPLSKWTKTEILSRCQDKAPLLSRLTVAELRELLLDDRGWHHTSKHFNRTRFYGIDEDALAEVTEESVNALIRSRKPRQTKDKPGITTITAEVSFTVWEGQYRRYRKPIDYTETITYHSTDKQVRTEHGGMKRLSSMKSIKILSEERDYDT